MKLKHIACAVIGFSLLTACYPYELDDADGRAERLAEKRAVEGCKMGDEHKDYRDCVIATAQNNSPKTYVTGEDTQGRAIAIIKSDKPCTNCVTTQTVVETVEVVQETKPAQPMIATPTVKETVVTTITAEPVIKEVPVPEDKTWWDEYKAQKKPEPVVEVKCPCEDPNDPCPQCVQK